MKQYYKTNINNGSSSGGIGTLGVLQIIFIVLKVLDIISWSWWQVFIPTFIGIGLVVIILLVTFVVTCFILEKEGKL